MMRTEPIFPAAPAEPSPLWGISRPAMTDRTAIIDRMVEDIAASRQFDRPNSTPGRWWLLGRGWSHRQVLAHGHAAADAHAAARNAAAAGGDA